MPFRQAPKWVLGVGVIAVVLGINAVLASVNFITANPSSCLTCHGTGGTPDMSKVSLVHPAYSKVRCVDCHAEPRQYVLVEGYRGGYSADPPRVSAACLRCHADIPSKEDTTGFKFNVLNLEVSHKAHVSERGVDCTDCHIMYEMPRFIGTFRERFSDTVDRTGLRRKRYAAQRASQPGREVGLPGLPSGRSRWRAKGAGISHGTNQ